MSESTTLLRKVTALDVSPAFDGYSKVILKVSDDNSYMSGTDAGRALEVECPWGTQTMANDILALVSGWQYKPYVASGALLDPAAEIGDGVSVNEVYSGIYARRAALGRLYTAEIEAPHDEEVDHEYPYHPQIDRKFTRTVNELKSELTIQATEIAAKVSETGGTASSFGWSLTASGFSLTSRGSTVFRCTAGGVEISGEINATSGDIGGCTIEDGILTVSNANITSLNGEKLVSNSVSGTDKLLLGSVTGGASGCISTGTISTANTATGINTSLGYANYAYGVTTGATTAQNLIASSATVATAFNIGTAAGFGSFAINGQALEIMPNASATYVLGYA